MADNVRRATVGDYVTLVRGTTYNGQLVGEPGPALLGLGSIEPGGGFRTGHYKTYGGECPDELMLFPGDVYASLKGATKDGKMIGSVARVPPSVPSGRLTQDTVKLVFRTPVPEDAKYLYWVLRTPQYRDYCAGHAMGSAVVALSRRDFLSYPVPPPTAERRKIVSLLDTIDDKIELNQRMSETLEAMARALFKSWFVDFDPVRAKAEGRDPGLPEHIADLFPARLVESEIGEIPEGWEVRPVEDVAICVGGSTPSTNEPRFWNDGRINWTTPKDLSSVSTPVLLDTERKITDEGLRRISSGLLPVGTLLLSSRAPVGYLAIAQVPVAINQGYIAIPPGGRMSPVWMLFWCEASIERIKARAGGTTFQEISKRNFRSLLLVVPSSELARHFDDAVKPVLNRIVSNERESRILATLRDTLLPKLISGQIRVGPAQNRECERVQA